MTDAAKTETTGGGALMPRWMLVMLGVFFVVYTVTVLATGEPTFLIPVVILAALVFGYALVNQRLTQRIVDRRGSLEDALSDEDDPIPSAHLFPDAETPLGDTPEAHDELSPHDLPVTHPGRSAAEEQAEGDDLQGTTGGDADPSQTGEDPR